MPQQTSRSQQLGRAGRKQATNPSRTKRGGPLRRRFWLERLEDRCVLAASPLQLLAAGGEVTAEDDTSAATESAVAAVRTIPAVDPSQIEASATGTAHLPVAPLPLGETFFLHSLPEATKTIYLDFTGHVTIGTPWNESTELPNIFTPAFSLDADHQFNADELQMIQFIWERVAEDFRPFEVNVTTEDPGIDALRRSGPNDDQWGIRVVIGGASTDWYIDPEGDDDPIGGVALLNTFAADNDIPTFVFSQNLGLNEQNIAMAISHEVGHTLGLEHHGEARPFVDPLEYYGGHGQGPTGWAPIMGAGFGRQLVQWSQGDYPWASNFMQDDLAIITGGNGFDYRPDDHGDTWETATPLDFTGTSFFGEGIIERNTDVDFFSFDLGVEEVIFEIEPFHRGPNLDILATLYDSAGQVITTSNPIDALNASFSINTPDEEFLLGMGRYYISIEGTGKPDTTQLGYSDYGSLGYYSIVGARRSFLDVLVGVDFDVPAAQGGIAPNNWTLYSGSTGSAGFLSDLIDETGNPTQYNLAIHSTGSAINSYASTANPDTVPLHPQPLNQLGGFIADQDVTWTFTWSGLDPSTVYEVYVFGLADAPGVNHVEIVGDGPLSSFTQTLSPDELVVHDRTGLSSQQLVQFAEPVRSTITGTITITVDSEAEAQAALAGLAIRPGTLGSIHGQKWSDVSGDGVKDPGEPGLEGWIIYLDHNDNGQWDPFFEETIFTDDTPQEILEYATVKSEIVYDGVAEILDVEVLLNITHSYAADLNVYLISPMGTRVTLFEDVGVWGENFYDTILDDDATKPITSVTPFDAPFTGRFRPQEPLSILHGEDPNGVWTLEVADDAAGHTGILNYWAITIAGSEPHTLTDANGNYSFEELPPGVYTVREVEQSGWTQTFASPPVILTSGARVTGVDFGNQQNPLQPPLAGSIQGQKWHDENGDGVNDPGEPGLAGWTIYLDDNENGLFDTGVVQTATSSDVPRAITDFSTVASALNFSGVSVIEKVELTFDITHSFVADLDAYLISPSGTQVKLFTQVGGQFNNFENTTLADDAETSITSASAPFTGSFRPMGLLSDFIGEDPNGVWQFLIRDTTFGDEGTLDSWSLSITGSERFTITDEDGHYEFLDLPPGDYVVGEVPQAGWAQTYPTIPTGDQFWRVEINNTGNDLTGVDFGNSTVATLPGDYAGAGVVDAAAYTVWRDGFGSTFDQEDYTVWKNNFGATLPGSGQGSSLAAATAFDDAETTVFHTAFEPVAAPLAAATPSPANEAALDQAIAALVDPLPTSSPNDLSDRASEWKHRRFDSLESASPASRLGELLLAARGGEAGSQSNLIAPTSRDGEPRETVDSLFGDLDEERSPAFGQFALRNLALFG